MKKIVSIIIVLILMTGCALPAKTTNQKENKKTYFADYGITMNMEGAGIPKSDLTIKLALIIKPLETMSDGVLYEGNIVAVSIKSTVFPIEYDSKTGQSDTKLDSLVGKAMYFTLPHDGKVLELSGYDKITKSSDKIQKQEDLIKESQDLIFDLFFSRDSFIQYFSYLSNENRKENMAKGESWEQEITVRNPIPYTTNAKFTYNGLTENKHSVSMESKVASCNDFTIEQSGFTISFTDISVKGNGKYIKNQGDSLIQSDAIDQNFTGTVLVDTSLGELYRGPVSVSVKSSFILTEKDGNTNQKK